MCTILLTFGHYTDGIFEMCHDKIVHIYDVYTFCHVSTLWPCILLKDHLMWWLYLDLEISIQRIHMGGRKMEVCIKGQREVLKVWLPRVWKTMDSWTTPCLLTPQCSCNNHTSSGCAHAKASGAAVRKKSDVLSLFKPLTRSREVIIIIIIITLILIISISISISIWILMSTASSASASECYILSLTSILPCIYGIASNFCTLGSAYVWGYMHQHQRM